jgi:hypothetical protein
MADYLSRIVFGYHGCLEPRATDLLTGRMAIADWPQSENEWDWLGKGIYFWEHAPERALDWARKKTATVASGGAVPGVVGAIILLQDCLDLTNIAHTELLALAYEDAKKTYAEEGKELPENRGPDQARKARALDCLVVNWCVTNLTKEGQTVQAVRCPFLEGSPVYPGSGFRTESHIQIAVRDTSCILGVFRPNIET